MSTASRERSTCGNPLCSCEPCRCDDCRCGAANLGSLERQVMEVIWVSSSPEVTVRSVREVLPRYAYTTLATVLDRLAAKGILLSRTDGRAKRFHAKGSRGAHTAVRMHEALAEDDDPEVALVRFARTLDERQATVLRQALLVEG